MSDWKESAIKHKYAELPEKPRYKKKKKPKRVARSDHKHHYACGIFNSSNYTYFRGKKYPAYNIITYCTICGRIDDVERIDDSEMRKRIPNPNLPILKEVDVWTVKNINLEDISVS